MESKLTLRLDKEIIESAKVYAKEKNISLSKLIENMLSRMVSKQEAEKEITPLVKSLSGVIPHPDSSEDYKNFLDEKYK